MKPFHRPVAAALAAVLSAAAFSQAGAARPVHPDGSLEAALAWHRLVLDGVERTRPTQHQVVRTLAYVSLAQHVATTEAPRDADTVAGASRAVLQAVAPAQAAAIDAARRGAEVPAGAGASVAERVVARARDDGFDRPWTGTPPTGPDAWRSLASPAAPPAYPAVGGMRTTFIASGDALRAPPPPDPGSARWKADLAELRTLLGAPTPEHVRIAKFYDMTTGTQAGGFWNERAVALIRDAGLDARGATRVLATLNLAMLDALAACHDSKYAYWVPRPSQVDPALRPVIGVPNHPSYPSNHSCLSTAAAGVLAHFFPAAAEGVRGTAVEAGVSRIHAGLHTRADVDAGESIGRAVAAAAIARHGAVLDGLARASVARR